MTFSDKLKSLGFATYEAYLQSEHWIGFRKRYYRSKLPKRCVVCAAWKTELHHRTYTRLGCELLPDVVPLCRVHHEQVHVRLDADHGGCVEKTDRVIDSLKTKAKLVHPPHRKLKNAKKRARRNLQRAKQQRKLAEDKLPRCQMCGGKVLHDGSGLCLGCENSALARF